MGRHVGGGRGGGVAALLTPPPVEADLEDVQMFLRGFGWGVSEQDETPQENSRSVFWGMGFLLGMVMPGGGEHGPTPPVSCMDEFSASR